MSHSVTDETEADVARVLSRALKIAGDLFKSTDPLLVMEIHDRLIARAHCCAVEEADEDAQPWK